MANYEDGTHFLADVVIEYDIRTNTRHVIRTSDGIAPCRPSQAVSVMESEEKLAQPEGNTSPQEPQATDILLDKRHCINPDKIAHESPEEDVESHAPRQEPTVNSLAAEETESGEFGWAALLSVMLTTSVAITSGVLWLVYKSDCYDLVTLRTGSGLSTFRFFAITLPLNIVAGLVFSASDTVRKQLLAPPQHELHNPGRDRKIQSFGAWMAAPLLRKALWLVLLIISLFIHLFINSLVMDATSVHDAYQVLVDERFLTGTTFDVSNVNFTQFPDEVDPVMPYGSVWPAQWPGYSQLQESLQTLQRRPSSWENISEHDCAERYNGIYTGFRNVVMVTNWTLNLDSDNSALAVAALSGSPHFSEGDRFKSLCPANYIQITPNAFFPASAKYLEPLCVTDNGTDCVDEIFHTGTRQAPFVIFQVGEDNIRAHDMCYHYRPQESGSYNWTEQLKLSYCLSEPRSEAEGRIVWNRRISGIVSIAVIVLAVTMLVSGLQVRCDRGFDGRYPWDGLDYCGRPTVYTYVATLVAFVVLAEVLAFRSKDFFHRGVSPSSPDDVNFTIGIAVYANSLQSVLALREVLEANMGERTKLYQDDRKRRWRSICHIRFHRFDILCFLWNLVFHLIAAAWSGVDLIDRYSLGGVGSPQETSIPTLQPAPSPFESVLAIWPFLFLMFHAMAMGGICYTSFR